jgi:hypothetical protein
MTSTYYAGHNDKVYFAAEEDPLKLGEGIWERALQYERYLRDTKLFALYCKMHWAYFGKENGVMFDDTEVGRDGAEGELHVLKINHLRSIVTSWDSILGNQRTAVQPVPIGDDYESEMQVKRGRAVLDHYIRSTSPARLECVEREVREFACVYGAGFGLQMWNPLLGPVAVPHMVDEAGQAQGASLRTGDLQSWALTPLDVAFDPWRKNSQSPWYRCRLWYPKHAIAKRWSEREEEILTMEGQPSNEFLDFNLFSEGSAPPGRYPLDELPLYVFFHEPNEALPNGKQVVMLSKDVVLEVGDLTYRGRDGNRRMPVHRLAPADVLRSPIGYTPAWGLLAAQEAIDSLSSIALTNSRTFGLGTMLAPKGGDVEPEQVSTGLLLVEYTQGLDKPSMMETKGTPPEVYTSRREYISEMGITLGVNGVVRGDPTATVDKSGSALALIDAKAVQQSSKFQGSCIFFKEEFYLTTICIAQTFMTSERQFEIMGESVATLSQPFSGKNIDRITKVKIESVNPLSQTISGRMQIADTIAQHWAEKIEPGDYFRVLETGNTDFLTRDAAQRERNMDRENELLSQGVGPPPPRMPRLNAVGQPIIGLDGQPLMVGGPVQGKRYVVAIITDDHAAHIRRHLCVLDNPAVREGQTPEAAAVLKAALDHIDEHVKLAAQLTTERAGLMQLLGYQPLQAAIIQKQMQMQAAMGGQPGAPPGGPPGMGPPAQLPHGGSPEATVAQPTPAGAGHLPRQPSMPRNPETGRRPPGPSPQQPQPGAPMRGPMPAPGP